MMQARDMFDRDLQDSKQSDYDVGGTLSNRSKYLSTGAVEGPAAHVSLCPPSNYPDPRALE